MQLTLRPLQAKDNPTIAHIIRAVSAEFGLAPEAGFAVADDHLDQLFDFYQPPHAAYWVIVDEHDQVYGGGWCCTITRCATVCRTTENVFIA